MNGIDAVGVAMGYEWMEALAKLLLTPMHSLNGRISCHLTKYKIENDNFIGRLELPISVGTKGGAI